MSTSISTSFITQYSRDVHEVFQRRGSHLLNAVFHESGVVGTTQVFHKIGTGTATTKSRHGVVTPMNQTHTAPQCTLVDFYAGDWVDKFDQAKTNYAIRQRYASGGAMALGRKIDDQITTVLDTTTSTIITLDVTSYNDILATSLTWVEAVFDNDVPNDGDVYGVLTTRLWSQLMTINAFASADFVGFDGMPFKQGPNTGIGKWKDWLGVKWALHTGLPGKGTSSGKAWIWHKTALGYASAAAQGNIAGNEAVSADVTWHGDRVAWFVNHGMSGQACMVDDTGVIEANWNDSTAVATAAT